MHPLDPLTPAEIATAAALVKGCNPNGDVHFKNITLMEPPKKELRKFLTAERHGSASSAAPLRRASALFYQRGTPNLFVARVDLIASKIEHIEKLDAQYHGQADVDEVRMLKDKCLSHPKVIERVRKYALPDKYTIVCDTWPYGRDSDKLERRLAQVRRSHRSL